MIEYDLKLTGRHRITFKRLPSGLIAVELSQPGHDSFGHGFLVVDSLFLEQEQLDKLCELLRSNQTQALCARTGSGIIAPASGPSAGQCKTR